MHVIKSKPGMARTGGTMGESKAFTTGSGLQTMGDAAAASRRSSKPAMQEAPNTRQLARDYAAFYGLEGQGAADQALDKARALKNGQINPQKPPDTRQFAKAYQAFFDVDNLNDAQMQQARAIKNGGKQATKSVPRSYRIDTAVREDPNFRANQARFHGTEVTKEDEFYKDYRAFYGGATPNVYQAGHMGAQHRNQQRTLLRNKLAENAKRILNQKDFSDGFQIQKKAPEQSAVLKESGFDAAASAIQKPKEEPASYSQLEPQGRAQFVYQKNPKIDKVTKTDPPIKNLGKLRYNIITGGLQEWY